LARAVEARDGGATREDRDMARLLFLDAQRTAQEAEQLGARGWRVDAVIALAAYQNGDKDLAQRRAEQAVGDLPAGEQGWNSMAVLDLFARLRWGSILKAVRAKESWPPEWLSDIHATCTILGQHPLGSEDQVA